MHFSPSSPQSCGRTASCELKGFIDRPGRDRREVIQGVGPRIERYFDRDWRPGEDRRTRIVVIGETGLDRKSIAAAINARRSA